MSSQELHPKWWQVYLTLPLLVVLFVMDHRLKISTRGHQAVQIGIILLIYGLIHLWLKANATALSKMDQGQYQGGFRVIVVAPSSLPNIKEEKHPLFELPHSEIQGVLSDTFEMDYVDVEAFPIDEVPQELKKE